MSPRRNRPKGSRAPEEPERPTLGSWNAPAPDGWQARWSQKEGAYICPSCNQGIPSGSRHIVAWKVDHEHDRRHYHVGCWEYEAKRFR